MTREYPDHPLPSVGAVIVDGDRVLLIRRGASPARDQWTFPGGAINLGETAAEALRREIDEECGLKIEVEDVACVADIIVPGQKGRIRYHYLVVDYRARLVGGTLRAGSDAREARWVTLAQSTELDLTPGTRRVLERELGPTSR